MNIKTQPAPWSDLTIAQTCEYMSLGRSTINALVKSGVLISYALGPTRRNGRRIRRDSIEALRNGAPMSVCPSPSTKQVDETSATPVVTAMSADS